MKTCEELDAELATITNAAEDSFASSILHKKDRWIGLNDREVEGKLIWLDSSPPSYANWNDGQPMNDEQNDCVLKRRSSGLWEVMPCSSGYSFICNMEATTLCSTTTTTTTTTATTTTTTPTTTTTTATITTEHEYDFPN